MNELQARQVAEQYLATFSNMERPLALDPEPEDEGWCFVFEWNTARFYQTEDIADAMGPGSGPIVVVKSTGDRWMLSSTPPFKIQLEEYANKNGITPKN